MVGRAKSVCKNEVQLSATSVGSDCIISGCHTAADLDDLKTAAVKLSNSVGRAGSSAEDTYMEPASVCTQIVLRAVFTE